MCGDAVYSELCYFVEFAIIFTVLAHTHVYNHYIITFSVVTILNALCFMVKMLLVFRQENSALILCAYDIAMCKFYN